MRTLILASLISLSTASALAQPGPAPAPHPAEPAMIRGVADGKMRYDIHMRRSFGVGEEVKVHFRLVCTARKGVTLTPTQQPKPGATGQLIHAAGSDS